MVFCFRRQNAAALTSVPCFGTIYLYGEKTVFAATPKNHGKKVYRVKRITALLLALVLALGLAACGETATAGPDAAETAANAQYGFYSHPSDYRGELPLVAEGEEKTLRIGLITSANVTDYYDNAYTKWLEEQTGVKIEFVQFSGSKSDVGTQVSLMIAANEELPDILLGIGSGSSGITKAAAKEYCRDGYFLDLREYMDSEAYYMHQAAELYFPGEKYAPFIDLMMSGASDPMTGAVYGYPNCYSSEADELHGHLWINGKWLENLGMEQPKTIEELYNVLVAFRDQDPNGNGIRDEIPMTGRASSSQYNVLQYVINAYVFCYDKYKYIVNDGVVSSPYDTEEYREALKFLKKLVDEQLLTPLTWTQSLSELTSLINPTDGNPETVGIFMAPGERFEVGGDSVYDYEALRLLEPATEKGGHGPLSCTMTYAYTFITRDCEDPLLAFRVLDFMSSPESYLRLRWGVPGEDWEYYDDPTGTAGMLGGPARIKVLNPNALNVANNKTWSHDYVLTSEQYWQQLVDTTDGSYTGTLYGKLQQQVKNYHEMGMNQEVLYLLKNTDEEDEEWNEVNGELSEFIMTARSNFCNGIWDPNSDSDWENYLHSLETLGYYDPWLRIAQANYDRR